MLIILWESSMKDVRKTLKSLYLGSGPICITHHLWVLHYQISYHLLSHVQGKLNWPPPYRQHAGQVSDAAAGHHRRVRLAGGGRAARPLPLHLRQVQAGAPQEEAGNQGE